MITLTQYVWDKTVYLNADNKTKYRVVVSDVPPPGTGPAPMGQTRTLTELDAADADALLPGVALTVSFTVAKS